MEAQNKKAKGVKNASTHRSYFVCLCVHFREIEYLKKETAQRRAQEETEATHKEETDNLQEKVCRSRKSSGDTDYKVCCSGHTVYCLFVFKFKKAL